MIDVITKISNRTIFPMNLRGTDLYNHNTFLHSRLVPINNTLSQSHEKYLRKVRDLQSRYPNIFN
ncbi:hypothetical protein D3C87_858620 [compost metagenome]